MGTTERFDTVIIGAGMSGLAAGIRLTQFDQRVLIVEKHYLWGGLNSYYKRAGRRFDVGLHALTNYVGAKEPGAKQRPLGRILRQLRLSRDELSLGEQVGSSSRFPGVSLRFSNDFELLRQDVHENFPSEAEGFDRLAREIGGYPEQQAGPASARAVLADYIADRQLVDLLLLPILYYGSPTENDLDWNAFVVLWKSLYEEGFARPAGGVRTILDVLRGRYLANGGELRMKCGVERVIQKDGVAVGLELADGTEVRADRILSSAGYAETLRLSGQVPEEKDLGKLSFVESISILDRDPAAFGFDETIVFFNTAERLVYARPDEPVDYRSGVICCPNRYASSEASMDPAVRLTLLANHDRWSALGEDDYAALKQDVWDKGYGVLANLIGDVRPSVVFKDTFTPRTIEHFTGHFGGAVYGCPEKRYSGEIGIPGLYLCGTDQGMLGIVGAMLSGIHMANRHALVNA
jgi:phytoene dehydrogenase-like protein